MPQPHPSTMLDDDGNQLPDVPAVLAEVDRLLCQINNAAALVKKLEGSGHTLAKQVYFDQMHASADSCAAVAESCIDWIQQKVFPAVSKPAAMRICRSAVSEMRIMHLHWVTVASIYARKAAELREQNQKQSGSSE